MINSYGNTELKSYLESVRSDDEIVADEGNYYLLGTANIKIN